MRPLVRLMLRKGVTYTMFADLLKDVFVDVAHRDFRLDGTPPTDSRISLLTGVHRKDVRRIRSEAGTALAALPANITLGAQLVNVWTTSPPFCSAPGQALALPRLASVGGDCSFAALVAKVSTDIRGRVVLDEWLRLASSGSMSRIVCTWRPRHSCRRRVSMKKPPTLATTCMTMLVQRCITSVAKASRSLSAAFTTMP